MGGGEAVIALGVGCRRDCSADDVVAAVEAALSRLGRGPAVVLGVPSFKSAEAGVREAAARLGVALLAVDDAALAAAQPRCATFSAVAFRSVGFASVAEAAALAAAGRESRLVVSRVVGGRATCAIAEIGPP